MEIMINISEQGLEALKQLRTVINASYHPESSKKVFNDILEQLVNNGSEEKGEDERKGKKQEKDLNKEIFDLKQKVEYLQQQVIQQHDELKHYQQDIVRKIFMTIADTLANSVERDEEEYPKEYKKEIVGQILKKQSDTESEQSDKDFDSNVNKTINSYNYEKRNNEQLNIVEEDIVKKFVENYNMKNYSAKISLTLPENIADARARGIPAESEEASKAIALTETGGEATYFAEPVTVNPIYYFVTPALEDNTFNYKLSLQQGVEDFYILDTDIDIRTIIDGNVRLIKPAIFEKKSNGKYYMVEKGVLRIE